MNGVVMIGTVQVYGGVGAVTMNYLHNIERLPSSVFERKPSEHNVGGDRVTHNKRYCNQVNRGKTNR